MLSPVDARELVGADVAGAVALWESCALTRPWNDPVADFRRALAGTTSAVLGLFDGDELVATAMVGEDGHRGWMYYLAVDPSRRRGGLGRRMVEEAEAWLRDRGVVKVNLMVRHDNAAAVSFYERLGYEDQQTTVLARWLT
jgi:ribosomal protein S18 acetylase RimI-like enzyme